MLIAAFKHGAICSTELINNNDKQGTARKEELNDKFPDKEDM